MLSTTARSAGVSVTHAAGNSRQVATPESQSFDKDCAKEQADLVLDCRYFVLAVWSSASRWSCENAFVVSLS